MLLFARCLSCRKTLGFLVGFVHLFADLAMKVCCCGIIWGYHTADNPSSPPEDTCPSASVEEGTSQILKVGAAAQEGILTDKLVILLANNWSCLSHYSMWPQSHTCMHRALSHRPAASNQRYKCVCIAFNHRQMLVRSFQPWVQHVYTVCRHRYSGVHSLQTQHICVHSLQTQHTCVHTLQTQVHMCTHASMIYI